MVKQQFFLDSCLLLNPGFLFLSPSFNLCVGINPPSSDGLPSPSHPCPFPCHSSTSSYPSKRICFRTANWRDIWRYQVGLSLMRFWIWSLWWDFFKICLKENYESITSLWSETESIWDFYCLCPLVREQILRKYHPLKLWGSEEGERLTVKLTETSSIGTIVDSGSRHTAAACF